MQRSNTYIVLFSLALTVVLGGMLSLASEGLKPIQKRAEELSAKRQILSAVMDLEPQDDVLKIFDERITSIVIDAEGQSVETDAEGKPLDGADLDIARQFKISPSERLYPVFTFHDAGNPDDVSGYIFAFYGNGLWDNIWGYMALEPDMNTIMGVVFDHAAETPGLGARITEKSIQERYEGKKIFGGQGNLISVSMLKGENNPPSSLDEHNINGLSGATITAKGVNRMLINYFEYYMPFIEKVKKGDLELVSFVESENK